MLWPSEVGYSLSWNTLCQWSLLIHWIRSSGWVQWTQGHPAFYNCKERDCKRATEFTKESGKSLRVIFSPLNCSAMTADAEIVTFTIGPLIVTNADCQCETKWVRIGWSCLQLFTCLVQVGNGIELKAFGLQFEPYLWCPCGVTWDSSLTVVVTKLQQTPP